MWFPNRSDTNQAVQSQKQTRSLIYWILEEEEVYYLCSKNNGADQLCSYRKADLRLCFCICRLLGFSGSCSIIVEAHLLYCNKNDMAISNQT